MSYRTALVVFILLPFVADAQDAVKRDRHQMRGLHNDPKTYIGSLEDPKRDAYQKPHEVVAALDLKPGEVIADIGAGSAIVHGCAVDGNFSCAIASARKTEGRDRTLAITGG